MPRKRKSKRKPVPPLSQEEVHRRWEMLVSAMRKSIEETLNAPSELWKLLR